MSIFRAGESAWQRSALPSRLSRAPPDTAASNTAQGPELTLTAAGPAVSLCAETAKENRRCPQT